ncbi:MAG: hypothetical protein J5J00_05540 [Deltaproteobacteria bacterium]|nr:hypothetical protein [Deltaproteobacteria bacterium]
MRDVLQSKPAEPQQFFAQPGPSARSQRVEVPVDLGAESLMLGTGYLIKTTRANVYLLGDSAEHTSAVRIHLKTAHGQERRFGYLLTGLSELVANELSYSRLSRIESFRVLPAIRDSLSSRPSENFTTSIFPPDGYQSRRRLPNAGITVTFRTAATMQLGEFLEGHEIFENVIVREGGSSKEEMSVRYSKFGYQQGSTRFIKIATDGGTTFAFSEDLPESDCIDDEVLLSEAYEAAEIFADHGSGAAIDYLRGGPLFSSVVWQQAHLKRGSSGIDLGVYAGPEHRPLPEGGAVELQLDDRAPFRIIPDTDHPDTYVRLVRPASFAGYLFTKKYLSEAFEKLSSLESGIRAETLNRLVDSGFQPEFVQGEERNFEIARFLSEALRYASIAQASTLPAHYQLQIAHDALAGFDSAVLMNKRGANPSFNRMKFCVNNDGEGYLSFISDTGLSIDFSCPQWTPELSRVVQLFSDAPADAVDYLLRPLTRRERPFMTDPVDVMTDVAISGPAGTVAGDQALISATNHLINIYSSGLQHIGVKFTPLKQVMLSDTRAPGQFYSFRITKNRDAELELHIGPEGVDSIKVLLPRRYSFGLLKKEEAICTVGNSFKGDTATSLSTVSKIILALSCFDKASRHGFRSSALYSRLLSIGSVSSPAAKSWWRGISTSAPE